MTYGRSTAAGFVVLVCLLAAGCQNKPASEASPASTAATAAAVPADPDAPPVRPRIVAFGDSLTIGLGLLEQEAYPALLQKKIDEAGYQFEVVNAGVSGDTSAGALRRLDWALQGDVKILIIALGANDGLRGLSVAEMKNNLAEIIQRARDRGVVCIVAGMEAPPNFGPEYTTAFRLAYRD